MAMNLNARAHFYAIQAALPMMLERGRSSMVNIASVCSSLRGLLNRFIYGTSKGATIGLTKQVAAEDVMQGVRCNCIAFGTVDTPSLHERLSATGDYKVAIANLVARQPIGLLSRSEEIAPLVVYVRRSKRLYE